MLLRASVKKIQLLPPRVRETPCLLGDFDWSCLFLWCNFDVLVINTFPTKVFFLQSGNDRPMYMYAYGNTNIAGNLKLSIGYLKQPLTILAITHLQPLQGTLRSCLPLPAHSLFFELEQFCVICILTIRRNASLVSSLFLFELCAKIDPRPLDLTICKNWKKRIMYKIGFFIYEIKLYMPLWINIVLQGI